MAVEQAGGGAGELLDEDIVLARVHYEISHVLSFAVMHKFPHRNEADRSLSVERLSLELAP
jgi:hypothetical protein